MRRALLVLALSACGTLEMGADVPSARSLDKTIHGDTRWNREERLLWEIAADELAKFTHGRARFVIVWDLSEDSRFLLVDEPRIVRAPAWLAPVALADAHEGGRVLAWTEDGPIIHVVAERCAELYPVILHELGHAAGLDHVPEGRGVMSRSRRLWKFTEVDRRECVRVGRCEGP